jgi:predicted dienelactone hydrolase
LSLAFAMSLAGAHPARAQARAGVPITPVVGETHRAATEASAAARDARGRDTLRITVWYPAAEGSVPTPLVIGPPGKPLFEVGAAAQDAPFAADPSGERRPVVLLSHGFGGSARVMGWLGTELARDGYVVIAVDHPGNNALDDMTVAGSILWWERAEDLRAALERVRRDSAIGPHLDLQRVAAAGFSAGGFTALLLGGARADQQNFRRFCDAHPEDGVCRPQVEFTVTEAAAESALKDPKVAPFLAREKDDHSLPFVRAVFVMAPAIVQGIEPRSLARMKVPVAIVVGDSDQVAPSATNARVAADSIRGAMLTMTPGATHYSFLATCTAAGTAALEECALAKRQEQAHRIAIERARELFARTLGAPSKSEAGSR